ncbi:MAG: hypothetical protein AAF674_16830 [Pseudomonadota bacterium]
MDDRDAGELCISLSLDADVSRQRLGLIEAATQHSLEKALEAYSESRFGRNIESLSSQQIRELKIVFLPVIISIRMQLEGRTLQ